MSNIKNVFIAIVAMPSIVLGVAFSPVSSNVSAISVLVGCNTWFSGNSTYAKCGSYDKYGRIYSYNAFAVCKSRITGGLRHVAGARVVPYNTSKATCAWYEYPISAGVSIN